MRRARLFVSAFLVFVGFLVVFVVVCFVLVPGWYPISAPIQIQSR